MSESGGMRKWVVLTSSAFSVFLGGSLSYCSGVFHVALLHHYQHDLVETAWLGSLFSCMFAVTGPVSSLVINMYSCRVCVMTGSTLILLGFTASAFVSDMRILFLTYSIIVGTGEGMVYIANQVVLSYYFPETTSIAIGCSMVGVGVATLVFPPLSQFLVEHFGLHGCFLLLGAIGFQTAVFGALMKPCDVELRVSKYTTSGKSHCLKIPNSLFGNMENFGYIFQPAYIMLIFSVFCMFIGNTITYLFLPDYFIKQGASTTEASLLVSIIGIGGLSSRTITGFAASDTKIGPLLLYSATYGITAILTFLIQPMSNTIASRTMFSFLFGMYASPGWVLFTPITIQIVGIRNLASAFGILMLAAGVGTLTGPPLAGLISEVHDDYKDGFYFAGAAFSTASIGGFLVAMMSKPTGKNDTTVEQNDINFDSIEVEEKQSLRQFHSSDDDCSVNVPGQ